MKFWNTDGSTFNGANKNPLTPHFFASPPCVPVSWQKYLFLKAACWLLSLSGEGDSMLPSLFNYREPPPYLASPVGEIFTFLFLQRLGYVLFLLDHRFLVVLLPTMWIKIIDSEFFFFRKLNQDHGIGKIESIHKRGFFKMLQGLRNLPCSVKLVRRAGVIFMNNVLKKKTFRLMNFFACFIRFTILLWCGKNCTIGQLEKWLTLLRYTSSNS